jgi:hypothetical protein
VAIRGAEKVFIEITEYRNEVRQTARQMLPWNDTGSSNADRQYWHSPKSKILIIAIRVLDQKTGTYNFLIVLSAQGT